jgi:hypothetical protein
MEAWMNAFISIGCQEFEKNGEASSAGGFWATFYAQPGRDERIVAECLKVFGLGADATRAQLKRTFRQGVKTAHPDQGDQPKPSARYVDPSRLQ